MPQSKHPYTNRLLLTPRGAFQNLLNQSENWGRRGCDNTFFKTQVFRNNRTGTAPWSGIATVPLHRREGGSFIAQNHMHSGGAKFVIDEGRCFSCGLALIFRTFRSAALINRDREARMPLVNRRSFFFFGLAPSSGDVSEAVATEGAHGRSVPPDTLTCASGSRK